jgi:UDP-N-acetylmuramoyl-L-alanyl-D-glutamate--2,6-diaminopimelate ligase
MNLKTILAEFPFPYSPGEFAETDITGVALDSRSVRPGMMFVALRGAAVDGHDFIRQAVDNGAAAVVGDREIDTLRVPYIRVENARQALTYLAAAFYDWPGRKLTVIGVTGTDGKTTTTNLIHQVLLAAGLKAGMISTVNAVIGDEVLDTGFHVTTPDAQDVQRYMAKMAGSGLTHVVLETTSHGWAQHRVDACEFDIGVVTNITHEHLDEHGSYENYRAVKARLFESLQRSAPKTHGNPRLAVINFDDGSYEYLQRAIKGKKVNYGLKEGAEVRASNIEYSAEGISFDVASNDFRVGISSSLVGAYNVSNCLAALTVAVLGLGIDPSVAARGIELLKIIPGRMERIDMGQPFLAVVDFAHTPNALRAALQAGRQLTRGRVIAVFGSAGLRDKEKRRMMAETAAELADLTVLTAEDPRSESLDGILVEMAAGASSRGGREGDTFWRIPDRAEAIRFALRSARPGDIVLACGKGHEQSMCFGKVEYEWDDRVAVRAALGELLPAPGPGMPYLPTQDKTESEWLRG